MVDMTDNEILGQRLQQCRESRKVTQQEMADAAGHSKNYISALEHGTNKMSVPTLIAYSKKLDMSIDEMLGLKPSDNIIPELRSALSDMTVEEQKRVLHIIRAL